MITALIVDSHPLVCDATQIALDESECIRVIGKAYNQETALRGRQTKWESLQPLEISEHFRTIKTINSQKRKSHEIPAKIKVALRSIEAKIEL